MGKNEIGSSDNKDKKTRIMNIEMMCEMYVKFDLIMKITNTV